VEGDTESRGFFYALLGPSLREKSFMSLVDKRIFALLSFFRLKKSSFPCASEDDITMELLLLARVDVGLFDTLGVEIPAPKIVLLKLSLYCLAPYLFDWFIF